MSDNSDQSGPKKAMIEGLADSKSIEQILADFEVQAMKAHSVGETAKEERQNITAQLDRLLEEAKLAENKRLNVDLLPMGIGNEVIERRAKLEAELKKDKHE